ncbi:MAG TPA: OmpA family protein [Symbiobacteriaceae bacterium]|nr:OmpA family protein [Symbiobacteriaceae bacterium]
MRWKSRQSDAGYWPSFVDAMSAVAVVMLFINMMAMLNNTAARVQIKEHEETITTLKSSVEDVFADSARTTAEIVHAIGEGLATIGENATIELNSDVLFAYDSDQLNEGAKPVLKGIGERLASVLQDPQFNEAIETVVVEGHTAGPPEDPFFYQWNLGARRAARVIAYFQETSPALRDPALATKLGASSYSYYRPGDQKVEIGRCRGDDECSRYRRIEIRVILKGSRLKEEIKKAIERNR